MPKTIIKREEWGELFLRYVEYCDKAKISCFDDKYKFKWKVKPLTEVIFVMKGRYIPPITTKVLIRRLTYEMNLWNAINYKIVGRRQELLQIEEFNKAGKEEKPEETKEDASKGK